VYQPNYIYLYADDYKWIMATGDYLMSDK